MAYSTDPFSMGSIAWKSAAATLAQDGQAQQLAAAIIYLLRQVSTSGKGSQRVHSRLDRAPAGR